MTCNRKWPNVCYYFFLARDIADMEYSHAYKRVHAHTYTPTHRHTHTHTYARKFMDMKFYQFIYLF